MTMTMQQNHEQPDFQAARVHAVVAAFEQRRIAAGYEMGDLLELIGVRACGTDPVSIIETLASTEPETPYETIRHRLNDPRADALLADIEAVRKMVIGSPLHDADADGVLRELQAVLGAAIKRGRAGLSAKELDDDVFAWQIALEDF